MKSEAFFWGVAGFFGAALLTGVPLEHRRQHLRSGLPGRGDVRPGCAGDVPVNAIDHFRRRLSELPDERLNALRDITVMGPSYRASGLITQRLREMVLMEHLVRQIEREIGLDTTA